MDRANFLHSEGHYLVPVSVLCSASKQSQILLWRLNVNPFTPLDNLILRPLVHVHNIRTVESGAGSIYNSAGALAWPSSLFCWDDCEGQWWSGALVSTQHVCVNLHLSIGSAVLRCQERLRDLCVTEGVFHPWESASRRGLILSACTRPVEFDRSKQVKTAHGVSLFFFTLSKLLCFSGNKWQARGMLFIPGLEYLLSSLFKCKSSSRCKWIQTPDYRFRFSTRWDGCPRPSPCGKLVSILKADGIAWRGCSGGSECASRLRSAFSENDPVITPDYLRAPSWWRARALSRVCVCAKPHADKCA